MTTPTRFPEDRQPRFAATLLGVLALAILARWLGYTGFFGSDEVTYTDSAFKLLNGDWRVSEYVGANRLGVNLPMAGFAWLLGQTEFAASAYSLLCSLGEVALVTWVGYRMFGARAALFAGLLMASLPAHVHFAGRLMADAPLCLTITATFALFYEAEVRRWPLGYFFAGMCAGLSFWIKPHAVFVYAVLGAYPLLFGRFTARWLWVAAGAIGTVVLNALLFKALTGDALFIFEAIRSRQASGYLEAGAAAGEVTTDAGFYLKYLFGKIYHTGLVGYLALLGGATALLRRINLGPSIYSGTSYTLFWALGLLLILSVLPVGFKPLLFVPKQTNYILIFVAPLCLLGGYGLARLPPLWSGLATAGAVGVGLLFAMLLQGSVAVFTANSEATVRYAQAQPDAAFFVMSNAGRAAQFGQLVRGAAVQGRIHPIAEWNAAPADGVTLTPRERYAVIDEETFAWDNSRPFARPQDVPACWTAVGVLRGQPRGLGAALLRIAASIPGVSDFGLAQRLRSMSEPKPAHVYRLPVGPC